MDKRVFYTKIILAQVFAFLISTYLIKNVFIGSTPIVQVQFQQKIKNLPQKTIILVKNAPTVISEKYNQVMTAIISGTKSTMPPPWVISPTPLATQPTVIVQSTIAPTNGQSLPTQQPFPTDIPPVQPTQPPYQPTQIPNPTNVYNPPTVQPTQPPQPTSLPPVGGDANLEQQTLSIINNRRKQQNLGTLILDPILSNAARRQSIDNSNNGQCDHYSSDGSDPFKRARAAGYRGSIYGETVACRMGSPTMAVEQWWGSPPHHAILTTKGVSKVGMGWIGGYVTAVVAY